MARILDPSGNETYLTKPTSPWFGSFNIRHTAADAAASQVLAVMNSVGSGVYLYIRYIRATMSFDGAVAAATSMAYEVFRYTSSTTGLPTTGTTLTRVRRDSRLAASVIPDANAQYKSGILTMAGVITPDSVGFMRLPASVTGSNATYNWDFAQADKLGDHLVIAPGEGLGIRLTNAAIIGQCLAGHIAVDERLTAIALS